MSEGRAWTQDDVIRLVKLLRDGRTTEEAAEVLHRSAPSIWQYMRHHRSVFQGLPERRGGLRVRATKMGGGAYMRRCHDCGAPTTDAQPAGRSCAGRAATTSVRPCRTSRAAGLASTLAVIPAERAEIGHRKAK